MSELVISKNLLIFSNNNNSFYSVNLANGLINWTQNINSYLRPAIVNDFIFTVTNEGYLIVIDKTTGNIIRITDIFDKFKIKQRTKIKPVGFVIGLENLYLSTDNGKLLVIDVLTGRTNLILKIDKNKISKPFISNNSLYLVKDDSIIRLK